MEGCQEKVENHENTHEEKERNPSQKDRDIAELQDTRAQNDGKVPNEMLSLRQQNEQCQEDIVVSVKFTLIFLNAILNFFLGPLGLGQ